MSYGEYIDANRPECKTKGCFANNGGFCRVLNCTEFSGPCPFYKTFDQLEAERRKSAERIRRIGFDNTKYLGAHALRKSIMKEAGR